MAIYDPNTEAYTALGGFVILLGAVGVEQAGLVEGALYEFTCVDGTAVCRWDTTAAASSDAGFTFFVAEGEVKRVRNPVGNTLLNIIEADAGSEVGAVLLMAQVDPS